MVMSSKRLKEKAELLESRSKMRKITESMVGQLAMIIQENFDLQVRHQPDLNWYAKWSEEKEDGYHDWGAKKHSEILRVAMEIAKAVDITELEVGTREWGVGDTLISHVGSVQDILEELPNTD